VSGWQLITVPRRGFLGQNFFELKEMSLVARLLRESSNGLAFGQSEIGRKTATGL
jgi:hypothetical protein